MRPLIEPGRLLAPFIPIVLVLAFWAVLEAWRWLRRENENGDRRVWWHWQNLSDEDENGQGRGFPWSGRAWLNVGRWRASINWGPPRLGASIGVDDEDGLKLHVGLPVSLWLTFAIPRRWLPDEERELGVRFSLAEGFLHWELLTNPMGSWKRRTSRWRSRGVFVWDLVLGKAVHASRVIREERCPIPLPEGVTMATVVLTEDTWKRPRWSTRRVRYAEVKPDKPAPVPGKGENSYDCGPDAIYGMSVQARTAAEGVGEFVKRVLMTRRKRGEAWGYNETEATAKERVPTEVDYPEPHR